MDSRYLRPAALAEAFDISYSTIRSRISEMKRFTGKGKRYPDIAIIEDGYKIVNVLAFTDFIKNRAVLLDGSAEKYLEPYDAQEIARNLGYVRVMK